jgi:iron(III) transport system substrate-binding protein
MLISGCRIEMAAPMSGSAAQERSAQPSGDVWVYTSMYRQVLDALEPVIHEALPGVTVHWFQAGSEKVASRLEAELAAGGTSCDVLITSDPFLYQRFKHEHRWLPYVSPNGVRTPKALVDLDGEFAAIRVSTMIIASAPGMTAPTSFAELSAPAFKDEVVLGDPLTSGTAFTWAVAYEQLHGASGFAALRANAARVAGGNAAVLQKLEGHEAKAGVLLLENALGARAKGSDINIAWPSDGAIVIPGYAGILATTRNVRASQALVDVLLAPKGQAVITEFGDMHAVDPRLPGPKGTMGLEALLAQSQPVNEAFLERGLTDGARVKQVFSQAFSQ